jgi:hypothetical protein
LTVILFLVIKWKKTIFTQLPFCQDDFYFYLNLTTQNVELISSLFVELYEINVITEICKIVQQIMFNVKYYSCLLYNQYK